MGTSIEMLAEVRSENTWRKIGHVFPNDLYDPSKPSQWDCTGYLALHHLPGERHTVWCQWRNEPFTDNPYDIKNYRLYAMLCGYATYDDVPLIADARGLPDDVSSPCLEKLRTLDASFCSWLGLEELQEWAGRPLPANTEDFFTRTVSLLAMLDEPENVRIVFGLA